MSETPKNISDLERFAGKTVEVESPMMDLLPKDATLVIAGTYQKKPTDFSGRCFLCNAVVWLNQEDGSAIASMAQPIISCPTCYFKMQPQETDA